MSEIGDQLYKIRHSLAHVLAQAVIHLYPNVKLGIGPVIENGFYYDFLFEELIGDEELAKIYNEMLKILETNVNFVQTKLPKELAIKQLQNQNQPFKAEIAADIPDSELSFYTNGDFTDLCKGPHVNNTAEINKKAFRLTHIAGAYWRGDENREMMQRIYGIAFLTEDDLNNYIQLQEEAKKRDHRKIGRTLDLFVFSDLVGSGLPLFTPKGAYIRNQLLSFSEELQLNAGFEKVSIPHITKSDLYKVSGHWEKYKNDLMKVYSSYVKDEFVIKPMNCPHHIQIFASKPRSYRELPIRFCETTTCYRDEKPGELLGLSRVRSLTQDDGHVFCSEEQVIQEIKIILEIVNKLYSTLQLSFNASLSFWDPENTDKYLGTKEEWEKIQNLMLSIVQELNLKYTIAYGEAAFYGPKIDMIVNDALGRSWQCATIQIDYFLPQRFNLTYVDKDGQKKPVVMIHKAILGSIERFLSVYIEHTGGDFPLWLSYIKAIVIPVLNKDSHINYAKKVALLLSSKGLKTIYDDDNDSLNNKIRKAQQQKIPYILVVGDKEIDNNVISVRLRNGNILGLMSLEELEKRMFDEIENKK